MTELHHISDSDFRRYQLGEIKGPELTMFKEHLLWCLPCLDRAEQNLRSGRQKKPARAKSQSARSVTA